MGIFKSKEDANHDSKCACGGSCHDSESKCSCGGACHGTEKIARIIVLGACCKKSEKMFKNTKDAVKNVGLDEEVKNIGDDIEIANYGVMQTPALVIDGKVVSVGKLLTVEQIEIILKEKA